MLEIEGLRKTYGDPARGGIEAIREVSFTVAENEIVSIVGPSGAGKTTLLRCLSGLQSRSGGVVRLDGEVVDSPPIKIAGVFQDYSRSLMPWFTIERNVGLPLKNKFSSKSEREARVADALRSVGLKDFGKRYPWELSGGMQQRVAIARAIAYDPEIMLMDEPFASVDAQTRAELEDLVLKIQSETGKSILLVTHDIDESVYLSARVVVLSARPTTVLEVVDVALPYPRDQIKTKLLPTFAECRSHVLELVRSTTAAAETAAVSTESPASTH